VPKLDGTPTDEELLAAGAAPPAPLTVPPASVAPPGYAQVKSFDEHQKQLAEAQAASQGYLDADQQKALFDMKYNEIMGPKDPEQAAREAAAKEAHLKKTRPDWYKQPDPKNMHVKPGWGAIGAGLGAVASGAQKQADLGAQMPGRWLSLKRQDQAGANAAGLLSSVGNYLINKNTNDQKGDLDTALKQAQLHRVLNPVPKGGLTSKGDDALSLIRANTGAGSLGASVKFRAENAERQQAKIQMEADEANPDSTISKAARQGLIEMGASPQLVGSKSAKLLRQDFPWLNRVESQEYQTWHTKFAKSLESEESARKANEEQVLKQIELENKRQDARAEASRNEIDWQPGITPTAEEQKKVGELLLIRNESITSINRLKQITDRMAAKYGAGAVGRGVDWFKSKGINLNPEDTTLITERDNIVGKLSSGSRLAQNMGAPTGKEYEISQTLTNAMDSVSGILNPNEFYQGLLNSVNRSTSEGIRNNRAFLKGTKPLEGAPRRDPQFHEVVPRDYTGGEGPPGAKPPPGAGPQQGARSPAPERIPLPPVPVTDVNLGDTNQSRNAIAPIPIRPTTPEAQTTGAKAKYSVDFHDGQGPQDVELTPEEVKEAEAAKATITRKQ